MWQTHHRFVNTTPNPRATKNNNGELAGLLELPLLGGAVDVTGMEGAALAGVEVVMIVLGIVDDAMIDGLRLSVRV